MGDPAFVDGIEGGNPAGVVLDSQQYTHEQKLYIAAAVGLSNSADFKLDLYTPTRQIAHCGHATIATFSYLCQLGLIKTAHTSKETIDGRREIFVDRDMAYMEQLPPEYTEIKKGDMSEIADSLGQHDQHNRWNFPPVIVCTGNAFLTTGFDTMEKVEALQPNFSLIENVSKQHNLIGYYVFNGNSSPAGRNASARMLAPRYGINEEAATGMAAGPLACLLHHKLGVQKKTLVVEQGGSMHPPSPSLITIIFQIREEKTSALMVGGNTIVHKRLTITIS